MAAASERQRFMTVGFSLMKIGSDLDKPFQVTHQGQKCSDGLESGQGFPSDCRRGIGDEQQVAGAGIPTVTQAH